MKIGLVDQDNTRFPNYALMQVSAYHKKQGDSVEWANIFGEYDIVYKSKVFTFSEEDSTLYKSDIILSGGTGYRDGRKDEKLSFNPVPDLDLYGCQHAYGFTTRGCIRNCYFCIVPEKEGKIRPDQKVKKLMQGKSTLILMDNNILAHPHGIQQIEYIAEKRIYVDFNQGLDVRLIDASICRLLQRVKFLSPLRISCDSRDTIPSVLKAVQLLRWYNVTPVRYFCYVMVRDIEEGLEIVKFLKGISIDVFVQPYRGYSEKDEIPSNELKKFARFVNKKQIFKTCTWEEYKYK